MERDEKHTMTLLKLVESSDTASTGVIILSEINLSTDHRNLSAIVDRCATASVFGWKRYI